MHQRAELHVRPKREFYANTKFNFGIIRWGKYCHNEVALHHCAGSSELQCYSNKRCRFVPLWCRHSVMVFTSPSLVKWSFYNTNRHRTRTFTFALQYSKTSPKYLFVVHSRSLERSWENNKEAEWEAWKGRHKEDTRVGLRTKEHLKIFIRAYKSDVHSWVRAGPPGSGLRGCSTYSLTESRRLLKFRTHTDELNMIINQVF